MSTPRTTQKKNDPHAGGPGSSHQGGTHGPATRAEGEGGASTSADRSRVSGGGGERDKAHSHDPKVKSSKHSASKRG